MATSQTLGELAVGTVIPLSENGQTANFVVAQHSYNSGRTLVVRQRNLSDQVVWDQPNYSNEDSDRQWGSHGGRYANIRTWLNSTYLARFSSEMQAAIGTTSYQYNAPGDGLGLNSDSTAVFVLSAAEIYSFSGAQYISNPHDGSLLPDAAIAAIIASGEEWFTRSIYTRSYTVDGSEYYNRVLVWDGKGIRESSENEPDIAKAMVRPCFTLPSDMYLDGSGGVTQNRPPVLSGPFTMKSELGVKRSGFTLGYTVTDEDGDTVTVTESIDGTETKRYAATLGAENTFDVSTGVFAGLEETYHTLTVTATDGKATATASVSFLKTLQNGYKVYAGTITGSGNGYRWTERVCIYDPTDLRTDTKLLIDPELDLEANEYGTFDFTLPTWNVYYDSIRPRTTVVSVEEDGVEIWMGCVAQIQKGFDRSKVISCDGELAYLADNAVRVSASTYGAASLVSMASNIGSTRVSEGKNFVMGRVSVNTTVSVDLSNAGTQYTNSWDLLKTNLLDEYGGYLKVRKSVKNQNGVTVYTRYLDYYQNLPETTDQVIEFGTNLLDLDYYIKAYNIVNEIVVYGYETKGWWIFEKTSPISVTVRDENSIKNYGTVTRYMVVDGEKSTADSLRTEGRKELNKQTVGLSSGVTISALDLRDAGVDTDRLSFLKKTRVISPPHGIDEWVPCTRVKIPLDDPANKDFTFGDTTDSLTRQQAANRSTAGRAWTTVKSAVSYINGNAGSK